MVNDTTDGFYDAMQLADDSTEVYGVGAFLLATQNALWQSSGAYITTAFAGLSTLAKLFNTSGGGPIPVKKK